MPDNTANGNEEIQELIRVKIENLRPKLLDLSRRNPLISTRFSPRSNSHIRVVDELPDVLSFYLSEQQRMRFVPLPPLQEDPRDEQSRAFQDALANARLTDEIYLTAVDEIDPSSEASLERNRQLERELRNRVRELLGMPPHQVSGDISLPQHAKNNGISPSYELPTPADEHEDGRHSDNDIQTLLLPDDLERKMNALITKCRTWVQETGINVLHAAFGFLEWSEPNGKDSYYAPLVLTAVEIEKKKTREGPEFWVKGGGDQSEINMVLAEKLWLDFGIELPKFEGGSIEHYLTEVSGVSPKSLNWRVRRQVAFGVFPSARMAMYHDLDTSENSFEQSNVLSRLLGGSALGGATPFADEYLVDDPDVEKKVPCLVLDADSSQFSTLVDLADGQNLAVEGPPGTGKSQTIVNAIAAALADGKKVLFVAQKMAALDVVKSRLEAVGLGEFILPLQAERSTREQVIQSIRDRAEMMVERISSDYEAKIARFRQTRSELAAYIDAISSEIGRTGFTVYDVLGKSIATNHVLLGKARTLQNPEIGDVEGYTRSRIDELRERGTAVETAWRAAEKAESYWRGHSILNIDRFSVEDICHLATDAAAAHTAVAEARKELVAFDFRPEMTAAELESLRSTLEILKTVESNIDMSLVSRVCHGESLQHLTEFLEECTHFRAHQGTLDELFLDASNETWGDRLRSIKDLCSDYGVDTLDMGMLQSRQQMATARLLRRKETFKKLRPFVDAYPESAAFSIETLRKARELVTATPRGVLALRNEITADPEAASVIEYAIKQGEEFLEKRRQLENVMSVTHDVSASELLALAVTISGAGPLSGLSSSFRSAKRTYLSLSRRGTFNKETAVTDIRSLIDWKEAEMKYCFDQQIARVFGLHFRGLDTDFEIFGHLNNYYEAVERDFSGPINRDIRRFLKTGDLDLLQSIPEVGEDVDPISFTELAENIQRIEARLPSIDTDLNRLASLISGLRKPSELSVDSLVEVADRIDAHHRKKTVLGCDEQVKELLADQFGGAWTDPAFFEADIIAAKSVLSLEGNSDLALGVLHAGTAGRSLSVVEEVLNKNGTAESALEALCRRAQLDTVHFSADRTPMEVADYLWSASQDKDGLYVHSAYAVARQDLDEAGFDWVTSTLLQENHPLDSLGWIIEAVIVRALAKHAYNRFGAVLSKYPGAKLDERRALLAKLDREIIKLSRSHLRARLRDGANPPPGVGIGRKSTWTEMALIGNEVTKKKRFIPVRDLTRRAGKALLELKPCWMMSPLAVAQYLPRGTHEFDLSIIDEASQMPPEEAVGALARSRQTMVVGDTNQLPPTSFFRKMVDDEDVDEDETVLDESILMMANAAFQPRRRLRWHYRSRHSALIRFSNHMVYDDDLIVFPSAFENRPGMGVSLTPVQGRYGSGTNSEEAAAMIDAALNFMRTDPDRSLGIVTLNQKQRDLLLEEMEFALNREDYASNYVDLWKQKNDGLESFFIKNLENVQGDERDVIFIGTVYGPEHVGGPVMQRFGPINGVAGKRRLNVLFSRAKQQIVTFSSMKASDIKAEEHGNQGVYMLKRWLEYSATGILHTGERTYREPDSEFEQFVIDQIRTMGCEAVPQIGVAGYFIDIGVKHPSWPHGYIMAVECDGAAYHSSKSARDRDRLRQEVLEGLGWYFHRIWSTDWFNDPLKETAKLRDAIMARLENLKSAAPVFMGLTTQEPESQPPYEITAEDPRLPEAESSAQRPSYEVDNQNRVSVGDTVRVHYLSGAYTTLEVTLSDKANAPERGIVHVEEPLGRAILGAEEGDEIEVLVGSYVREAIIEKITKCVDTQRVETSAAFGSSEGRIENVDSDSVANRRDRKQGDSTSNEAMNQPNYSQNSSSFSPDRFYQPEYKRWIRHFAVEMIDAVGPITFKHLADRLARAHGFQRTGSQIKSQVWAAISKARRSTKASDGETIFWPDGSEPTEILPFRGLIVGEDRRSWHDIPYPEKIGLARSFLNRDPNRDIPAAMASKIGLGRLRQTTRKELEALLKAAKELGNQ